MSVYLACMGVCVHGRPCVHRPVTIPASVLCRGPEVIFPLETDYLRGLGPSEAKARVAGLGKAFPQRPGQHLEGMRGRIL